ncbi:DUF3048 domain-containing protein [Candidatus Uhrbacteria bacterium]|nr:DUF3048 domain-containing protein [Candidatus Uhrbacteria bacterium]
MGSFLSAHNRRRFPWQGVVFFVCIVVVAGVGVWLSTLFFASTPPPVQSTTNESPRARRFLDGVWVEPDLVHLPTIGVMIENFIDARPASGVARAQLVFEAPVEAGITRFLALYGTGDTGTAIGPVRSLRPYYLDWAKELGAAIVHVGGSDDAIRRVRKEYDRFDIDQFFESGSFWRTKAREAPHNVYTTLPLTRDVLKVRGVIPPVQESTWTFIDDPLLEARPESEQNIELVFSTDPYTVRWTYDRATNTYFRSQFGAPHLDADGTEIRAKNIVVIPTAVKILDTVGRRAITLLGSGQAIIFRDGTRVDASWRHKATDARLQLVASDGTSVSLTAGTTWVEIFPRTGTMRYNSTKEVFNK